MGRSERLGLDLKQSSDKIDALERTLEDLRNEATPDGLTGIANRRYLDMVLQTTLTAKFEKAGLGQMRALG